MDTKVLLKGGVFLTFLLSLTMQVGCNPSSRTHMAKYNYLILKLQSDRSVARVGEPVHIRFTITNEGGDTWLESPTTPVMDIVVSSVGSGKVLIFWSAQNPDKVAHRLEWKPGESKVIEFVWTPRQEDIAIGVIHNIHLAGWLYQDSKLIQSAGVTICASNVCRDAILPW